MNRTAYIEALNTDLNAGGQALAERLHGALAQELTASFQEAAREFDASEDDDDLILPGFAYQTLRHLSDILAESARGWETVFWTNLATKYEETGEA